MKCGTYGENVFPDEDCVVDRVKHTHHHHVAILLYTYLPHVRLERLDYRLPHLPSQEQTSETNGQSIVILQGIVQLKHGKVKEILTNQIPVFETTTD